MRRIASALSAMLLLAASVALATPASAAGGSTALTAEYGADEVKAVMRNPVYPLCSGPITITGLGSPYSDSRGNTSVDLANPAPAVSTIGAAYLKVFASGNSSQPWGVAMYQQSTNLEVKWNSTISKWVLPGETDYGSATPFAAMGQVYGLYSGGFLHISSPADYGNFFLIGQTWPGSNSLTYTPDPAQNECVEFGGSDPYRSVATAQGMENGDGSNASAGSDETPPPPPWLQSYGRAANELCRTGWHPSWAEWAVDKTGGWVCNRTVFWNGSTWVQNPSAVWGAMSNAETTAWDASN